LTGFRRLSRTSRACLAEDQLVVAEWNTRRAHGRSCGLLQSPPWSRPSREGHDILEGRWCRNLPSTRERYKFFGPGKGDSLLSMLEDLADLFEQSAANGTPVRAVVGEDPVEFAEAFLRNYPEGQWISRERERLPNAIDRVAGNEP
jgi:hypothetical protein